MATKFSKKMGGKEVGSASVYAKPHSNPVKSGRPVVSGEKTKATRVSGPQPSTAGLPSKKMQDPNTLSAKQVNPRTPAMRVSAGDPAADDVKTSGIKIRGTGAATKGLMARGPMA
jgi:hypothetical protein